MAMVLTRWSQQSGSAALVRPVWSRLAGEVLSTAATPDRWAGEALVFRCQSAEWARTLSAQHEQWLQRLRTRTGCRIDALQFEAP